MPGPWGDAGRISLLALRAWMEGGPKSGSRLGSLCGPLSCGLQLRFHGSRLGVVDFQALLVGGIQPGVDLGRLCVIAAGCRLGRSCESVFVESGGREWVLFAIETLVHVGHSATDGDGLVDPAVAFQKLSQQILEQEPVVGPRWSLCG